MTGDILDEPVRSIATHGLVTGRRADTLRGLAQGMIDNGVSALVIEERSGELAIVTERDIVAALSDGADPDTEWAVDVMTRDIIHVEPDASIADVAELMLRANIRHVLVRGDGDTPGVVSVRDLLDPLLQR